METCAKGRAGRCVTHRGAGQAGRPSEVGVDADRRRGGRRARGPAGAGLPRAPSHHESAHKDPAEMPRGIRGAEVAGGEGIGAAALAYLRQRRGSAGGKELSLGFRAAEVGCSGGPWGVK